MAISLNDLVLVGGVGILRDPGPTVEGAIATIEEQLGAVTVRGHLMTDWSGLFDEFSTAYHFPAYFGRNFEAFVESLAEPDYPQIPTQICVVREAQFVLVEEPIEELGRLLRAFAAVNRRMVIRADGDVNGPRGTFTVVIAPSSNPDGSLSRWVAQGNAMQEILPIARP